MSLFKKIKKGLVKELKAKAKKKKLGKPKKNEIMKN